MAGRRTAERSGRTAVSLGKLSANARRSGERKGSRDLKNRNSTPHPEALAYAVRCYQYPAARDQAARRLIEIQLAYNGASMDLNRHQFLFLGLFILLIGLQFRYVQAYVLNPQTTQFLAERTGQATPASGAMFAATGTAPRKVIQPPDWLSWCLISVGAVLALHSLAMQRPA
jgi:hypothetical protein